MDSENVYQMRFSKIYPLPVNKAVKKGRTVEEVNRVICWLTGCQPENLDRAEAVSYGDFFRQAPWPNPA